MSEWINVHDEMPSDGELVSVLTDCVINGRRRKMASFAVVEDGEWLRPDISFDMCIFDKSEYLEPDIDEPVDGVTHWLPLPDPAEAG